MTTILCLVVGAAQVAAIARALARGILFPPGASNMAGQIGELIQADQAATADLTTAQAALAAAQQGVTDRSAGKQQADAALGQGLAALARDVFLVNPDGTATIYIPDGRGGFTTSPALPAETVVPDPAPAPVPPPAGPTPGQGA
jgi:hypothetical protein